MIKKVLIAEDHESANISVRKTLEEMGIIDPAYVYYCDDAIVRIQKAKDTGDPYDLLITDLYFDDDHSIQKIKTGAALIEAVRRIQPDLNVLVFSAEIKYPVIEDLFNDQQIDGYVSKGRGDARELKKAIEKIAARQRYYPHNWVMAGRQTNVHEFTTYDKTIIRLMACGMRQKNIPDWLKENNIEPFSLSSMEKRLNLIREAYGFCTNEQLVALCKEKGII